MEEKPLEFPLDALREGENRFELSVAPGELGMGDWPRVKGKVRVTVVINKLGDTLNVKIHARFSLALTCARCLKEFTQDFSETLSLVMRRGSERIAHERLTDEDIATTFYTGPSVDLTPPTRDLVVLAPPLKPLCKPDCKGLCPVCGADLNQGPCEHVRGEKRPPDPRWAPLLELRDKLEGK